MDTTNPREVDEALAIEHGKLWQTKRRYAYLTQTAQAMLGDHKRDGFGGYKFLTTAAEAWARVETAAAGDDTRNLMYGKRPSDLLTLRAELDAQDTEIRANIFELDKHYTGWPRYFVVTSSAGHVHSSMACHTCRITTTYGWVTKLSGESEADAVIKLGPALCSVCFPSAPVEWQRGKVTKAKAAKLAADKE